MSDEDATPGRHRAPASVLRRTWVRLGIAALGVLLAAGLGMGTAEVLGLTDVDQETSQAGPPRVIPPAAEEQPRPGRTIDLTTRPAPVAPSAEDLPADPAAEAAPPAAAGAPAEQPAPASGGSGPAPDRTVRTGDSCSSVGQAAPTTRGDTAVCTASPGNGPNKWRAA